MNWYKTVHKSKLYYIFLHMTVQTRRQKGNGVCYDMNSSSVKQN